MALRTSDHNNYLPIIKYRILKRAWKLTLGSALVLALIITGFWAFRVEIAKVTYQFALSQIDTNLTEKLADGIHVYVCGAGSPLPDPKRGGSCLGILAGADAFIFDAGSGGSRTLTTMGFPFDKLRRIFITHYHSDHIDGLGELLMQAWISGHRTKPITVVGPVGVETVLNGFLQAYSLDRDYRIKHHKSEIVNEGGFGGVASTFDLTDDYDRVYEVNGVLITAFRVDHRPVIPAVGYRVDYGSRSVVISGDTAYDERVITVARETDLLIHEALNRDMVKQLEELFIDRGLANNAALMHDTLDYHTSPTEAAQIAARADARELLLYHIAPPLPINLLNPMFLDGVDEYFDGKVTIAEDGILISMPSSSKAINHTYLGP